MHPPSPFHKRQGRQHIFGSSCCQCCDAVDQQLQASHSMIDEKQRQEERRTRPVSQSPSPSWCALVLSWGISLRNCKRGCCVVVTHSHTHTLSHTHCHTNTHMVGVGKHTVLAVALEFPAPVGGGPRAVCHHQEGGEPTEDRLGTDCV